MNLAKRALHLATYTGAWELQRELVYRHDVALSDTVLNRLMQRAGGVAEQDREAATEALSELPKCVAREQSRFWRRHRSPIRNACTSVVTG